MPIFLSEGQAELIGPNGPVAQCCMGVLCFDYFKINPEFSRKLNFHRSLQPEDQSANKWADELDRMAEQCDMVNLTEDNVFVLKYYNCVADKKLLHLKWLIQPRH